VMNPELRQALAVRSSVRGAFGPFAEPFVVCSGRSRGSGGESRLVCWSRLSTTLAWFALHETW
jgi:hypothetical protein